MLYNIRNVCLIFCCLALVSGCNKDTPESPHDVDIDEVQKEAAEAIVTTDDYLRQEKERIMENATQSYNQLKDDAQKLLSDIKQSGKDTLQGAQSDLDSKLEALNQTFTDLKESSEENIQKSRDAFNVAADELKNAYEKTKAEFQKEDGS
jgi:hypothetical protein